MGNAAKSQEGLGMCLLFTVIGCVKFIGASTEAKIKP